MAGAFREPRGPERRAVLVAAAAIEDALRAGDPAAAVKARRAAANALHEAWAALTTFQPFELSRGRRLNELRAINRQLHAIFAEWLLSPAALDAPRAIDKIRKLADAARSRKPFPVKTDQAELPLGRLELWKSICENLALQSPAMRAALLVLIASGIAAAVSLLLHLERPYWSIAAAVLVLHQSPSWTGVLRKAVDRVLGTVVGLLLGGAILLAHLTSVAVLLSLMVLQFITEMLVVRHYALAVIFITANALLIASGGSSNVDVGGLIWGRGIDTLVGCLMALLVYASIGRRHPGLSLAHESERVEEAVEDVQAFVTRQDVISLAARRARRDLQHRLLTLAAAQDRFAMESSPSRIGDRRILAEVESLEERGYATLAACWSIERERIRSGR
jgi:uncharacterized membrane protein YccC